MNKKMSVMGVGGKIAVVLVAYLAIAIAVDSIFAPLFRIAAAGYSVTLIVGIILAVVGFALNLAAAFAMLKAAGWPIADYIGCFQTPCMFSRFS